jgi:hypothetical protein
MGADRGPRGKSNAGVVSGDGALISAEDTLARVGAAYGPSPLGDAETFARGCYAAILVAAFILACTAR